MDDRLQLSSTTLHLCDSPRQLVNVSWASAASSTMGRLRYVIVSTLQGKPLNIQSQRDIVDFMRKHEGCFPDFRASHTYKLLEQPIFENQKTASGDFY